MGHHHHHHGPSTPADTVNQAFLIGIGLNIVFVIIEVLVGSWYDSLALLSDAGHNFSDVLALLMALVAFKLLSIAPSERYTYGYRRTTIGAALVNALLLLVAVGMILWESVERIQNPVEVDGVTTALVAGIGILINGFTAWLFVRDKDNDLNIKGAYLHMLADTLVSVGVVVSGLFIWWTQWYWVDTVMSWGIVAVILLSTWSLLKDSLSISLDGVPRGMDLTDVIAKIEAIAGVKSLHHVHLWALSTAENALTAHLVVDPKSTFAELAKLKQAIKHELSHQGVQHVTLEIECEGEHCPDLDCTIVQQGVDAHAHHHHH